jgi:2-phospho-L-lactate guanylyltransferase (CobY/MobA/RfbA family)
MQLEENFPRIRKAYSRNNNIKEIDFYRNKIDVDTLEDVLELAQHNKISYLNLDTNIIDSKFSKILSNFIERIRS